MKAFGTGLSKGYIMNTLANAKGASAVPLRGTPGAKVDVKKEIRVFGIRRSGNHAVINWILKQVEGQIFFLNNTSLLRPLWQDRDFLERERAVFFLNDGETLNPTWQDEDLYSQNAIRPFNLFLHSYENARFARPLLCVADHNKSLFINQPEECYEVLILRDPFNLFSSRLQSGFVSTGRDDRYNQVDLWLYYAEEYLSRSNQLGDNKLCVNYDLWCEDKSYRQTIAENLGIEFTDRGFYDVSRFGGGSSFDGRKLSGKANEMATNVRWRKFVDEPRFIDCFRDPLVLELSEEIFGEIAGTREFLRAKSNALDRRLASVHRLWVKHVIMRLMDWRMARDSSLYMVPHGKA